MKESAIMLLLVFLSFLIVISGMHDHSVRLDRIERHVGITREVK